MIGNFVPYYEGKDTYLYATGAISLVEGTYEYTNEIIQKTDFDYTVSTGPYIKTPRDTLIPTGGFGIIALSAFSYLLGSYYGLFYLGPIATILFLIISERVFTKLFGSFVGLVGLIFLSTDIALLNYGSNLLTGVFSVIGVFSLRLISNKK